MVLSAAKNPDVSGFYHDFPEYDFKFFTATYDNKADRISAIDPIKLRSYKDLMDDISQKKIHANVR